MPLSWTDDLLLHHAEIDAQHKALFGLANALLKAGSPAMQLLVAKGMYDHTRDHFKFEESLMDGLGYPQAEHHKLQHRALLKRLTEITHGIGDRSLHLPSLDRFIDEWLSNHIATEDSDLVAHLRI